MIKTSASRNSHGGAGSLLGLPVVRAFIAYYGVGSLLTVGPNLQVAFLGEYNLEAHITGLVLAASSGSAVAASAAGGRISDREGPRACFLAGLLVQITGLVLMAAAAHSRLAAAIGVVAAYASSAMMGPAVTRALASMAPHQLATALSLLGSIRSLLPVGGCLLSAFVADTLGWPFLFLFKACLLAGVGSLVLRVPLGPAGEPAPTGTVTAGFGRPDPGLILILAGAAGLCALDFAPSFLPYLMTDRFRARPVAIGTLDSIYNLVWAVGALPAGALADRVGALQVTLIGYGLTGVSRLMYAAAPSLALIYISSFASAVGNCLGSNAPVFAVRVAGERRSGTAAGYFSAAVEAGSIVGMLAGGLIWSRVGPVSAFVISSLGSAWAIALYTCAWRRFRRAGGHAQE